MKKMIALLVVAVLVILLVKTYVEQQVQKNQAVSDYVVGEEIVVEGGEQAPNFTLQTLDGESVTLADLRGKNVIVNFWATWCAPCRAEMPEFQRYYEQYRRLDNVEIVAVNMTFKNDTPTRAAQFKEAFNLTFPIVLEPEQSVSEAYRILTIPSTFFIDAQGVLQHYVKGPLNTANLRAYVQQLQ